MVDGAAPPTRVATRHGRQRRAATFAVLGLAVAVTATMAGRSPAGAQDDLVEQGRQLYLVGCVSCHGPQGGGVGAGDDARGPSLEQAGAANAYYQLATGRMPLNDPDEQPQRKDPVYDEGEIAALVAYVATLGDGPALPGLGLSDAEVAAGGVVFRTNCQACHSATGSGGALSYGRAAPDLASSEPEVIAAAVRAGPGQMPVFARNEIDEQELADVVTYVLELQDPEDRGGLPIGRVGPVPEGFVAWSVGVTALLASVFWIGTRSPVRRRRREPDAATATPEDAT